MCAILRLQHNEPIRLDHDQLVALYQQFGPAETDRVVSHGLEELSLALAQVEEAYRTCEIERLRASVTAIVGQARQLGMVLLARVGRDVLDLCTGDDAPAFAAAVARLERIGESSVVAVWDLQDLSV